MAVHANTRVSSFQADNIIVHRNEPDYLSRRIYNAVLNSETLSLMLSMNGRSCLLNELMISSAVSPTIHM
ncbi:plasmid segregation protein ParM [Escherichia coli]